MANEAIPATMYTFMQARARTCVEGAASASRSITYKRQTAETYTTTTQVNAPTYSDTAVVAVRLEAAQAPVGGEQGAEPQSGDVTYLIEKQRLSTEPTTSDRIVDGSDTFEVYRHGVDAASLLWVVNCRKVAA